MKNKQDLKGGEIENEDLNNCNYNEDNEKKSDMVKRKTSTKKSSSKPKKTISGYKKAKKGLSKLRRSRP